MDAGFCMWFFTNTFNISKMCLHIVLRFDMKDDLRITNFTSYRLGTAKINLVENSVLQIFQS